MAFHPDFTYGLYDVGGTAVIVAERMADQVAGAVGRPFGEPLTRLKGRELENLRFRHPLYERDSVGVLATT